MDISKAKNIVIVVNDRRHEAEFVEKTADNRIVFKVLERDHPYIKSRTGHRCQVLMTIGDGIKEQRFFVEGRISSERSDVALVWMATNLMLDRRKEERFNILPVYAKLEIKKFFRVVTIPANITNISKSGVGLQTHIPLAVNKTYNLETKFRCKRVLESFSASYTIRYILKKGTVYLNSCTAGGEIEKTSLTRQNIKVLNEFLKSLEN
ncbi:hypothetical protein M0P98_02420 [bacterium]|nr:hypothetical protein [bacterium]